MLNPQLNQDSVYRSYLPPLIGTALLILLGHTAMYYYYYSDVFWPRTLPYYEDFTADDRLELRQVGGNWKLENERLIQHDANLVDILAVIPALELDPAQPYEFSTNISVLEGPKGGGIVFNMQDRGTIVSSHLVRLGSNEGGDYLIYGYFGEDRNFNVQGSVNPQGLPNEFKLGVNVTGETYSVLLNDQVIATDIEVKHPGGNLALTTWKSKVAFDNVAVVGPDQPIPVVESAEPAAEVVETTQTETVVVQQAAPAEPVVETQTVVVQQQPAAAQPAQVVAAQPQQNAGVAVIPAIGELPYFENFTDDTELEYNIINGDWALQDESIAQINPDFVDVVAAIPNLSLSDSAIYDFSADMTMIEGAKGGGLMFNMQRVDSVRGSHMLRLGQRADGNEYLIYGYFDENRAFVTQGTTQPLEYDTQTNLGISVNEQTYNILMNDQTIIRDIPLIYKGGRPGLVTWNSAVQFDNVTVTGPDGELGDVQVSTESVATGSLPMIEDFTGDTDHSFIEVGGNWQLQEETLLQLNTEVADIMALVPDFVLDNSEQYVFSADMQILEGPKGGGLVFNTQNADSVRESHIVRFGSNDGNDYMIYGYFDENRSFNAQGSAQPPAFSDEVNLGVSVSGSTYDILVNEEIVARDIPLAYLGGRVGLTTWNTSVGFDDISVVSPFAEDSSAAADIDPFADPRPLNTYFEADLNGETDPSNWAIVNGDWEFAADGIMHPNAEWFDNLIMHANEFESYSFTTNMQMGEGEGGAGVAFNIPSTDSINGSHIVRYLGNEVLTWGYFDNDGAYVEQGTIDVSSAADSVQQFEVRADGTNYSVRLNGQLLSESLPLYTTQGRVGFTSTLREVTFDDILLTSLPEAAEGN